MEATVIVFTSDINNGTAAVFAVTQQASATAVQHTRWYTSSRNVHVFHNLAKTTGRDDLQNTIQISQGQCRLAGSMLMNSWHPSHESIANFLIHTR